MSLNVQLVESPVAIAAATFTEGFLTNNGVDDKHEVAIAARLTPSGPIQDFLIIATLPRGQGVRFNFQQLGGKVIDYTFYWRDNAGRVRYNTGMVSAPTGRFFSSIGGWWMTDPGIANAQSWLPYYKLA